ncbi:MAG: S9 family peptidase [Anaeromyxobacter sp.]|nr:S9 family peptidase [Anaeromyxobacter sp.]MBL0278198.1 S9 family peptidase [Anaeromyxobacter sp.]
MTTSLLLALALLATPAPAGPAAAGRRPFSLDDLLSLERVGEVDLSPDGALLAYTLARVLPDESGLRAALWLVPAAGGAPRRLTHGEGSVRAPRFSPDGRTLAFVATRGGSPQISLLPLDGGEAAPAPLVPGGVADFRFAPDGALLVLAEVDPACGADLACNQRATAAAAGRPYRAGRLLFRHWDEWRTRLRVHLLRVPLDGGAAVDLTPGDRDAPPAHRGGLSDVATSPDGRTVLYAAITDPVEATSTNADLYAVPAAGGPARQLTRAPGWDGAPRPSPDGRRLAWLRMPRPGFEADRRHVMVAAADGSGERDLTADLDVSADELWWTADGRALRFSSVEAGRSAIWQVPAGGGTATQLLASKVHLAALRPGRDGRRLAALLDSLDHPAEVALVEACPQEAARLCARPLTRTSAAVLDRVEMGAWRPLEATSPDGAAVHGWLLTPPGHRPGQRHPTVVLVHGGPQGAWSDAWSYRWNPQLYAARGWTVVLPNPRGSTGHGQAYTDAVSGDWGGAPYQDIMALTDAAVASGEADGARACAAGASYGGYMVNWINGQTDRFRCLVSHAGTFDTVSASFDTEELWFTDWDLGRGKAPWQDPAAYERWSPRAFVARWRTPTLVTHGELDYRVTVTQGLSTFTALQRRGIESRLLVFPDENHWILKPRNARIFHEEVLGWIERHLGAPKSP